jgi:hypothetical protein
MIVQLLMKKIYICNCVMLPHFSSNFLLESGVHEELSLWWLQWKNLKLRNNFLFILCFKRNILVIFFICNSALGFKSKEFWNRWNWSRFRILYAVGNWSYSWNWRFLFWHTRKFYNFFPVRKC